MLDQISQTRLADLHPALAAKIRQMSEMLELDNPPITFRVTQGLRSWSEQLALYSQGRTTAGKIVTDAKPGYSWHQFGLAADIVPFAIDGSIDWNTEHPTWKRLIQVGESLGLTAGATFRTFPDEPHFQLTGRFPETPDDEVRQLFTDGGVSAVWEEAQIV